MTGERLKKGRDFAASLRINPPDSTVPEAGTGGGGGLLGISKRGDSYLRSCLSWSTSGTTPCLIGKVMG